MKKTLIPSIPLLIFGIFLQWFVIATAPRPSADFPDIMERIMTTVFVEFSIIIILLIMINKFIFKIKTKPNILVAVVFTTLYFLFFTYKINEFLMASEKLTTMENLHPIPVNSELVLEPEKWEFIDDSNNLLVDWANYYKSLDSSFSLDLFQLERTDTLNFIQGNVFGIFDKEFDEIYNDFIVYSPNGKRYLDFDSYQWTIDENRNTIFSADQEINLIDLNAQTVTRIAFRGPLLWVENALWRDDSTVVLLENSSDHFLRISELNIINGEIKTFKYSKSINTNSQYFENRLIEKGLHIE